MVSVLQLLPKFTVTLTRSPPVSDSTATTYVTPLRRPGSLAGMKTSLRVRELVELQAAFCMV